MSRPTRAAQVALDLSVLVNFIANGLLLATIPRYMHGPLGASRTWVGIGTTGFFFIAILVRPAVGRIIDRRGRLAFVRWPLLGLAVVAMSFGAVNAIWWIIALRFVQGAVGSGFYTAAAAVVTDLYPPSRRASAISRLSLNVYVGFVAGPVFADFLIRRSYDDVWRAAALLHLVAFAVSFLIPETTHETAPRPVAGGAPVPSVYRAVLVPGIAFGAVSFAFATVVTFHAEYADRLGIDHPGWLFATYAFAVLAVRTFIGRAADAYGPARVALPCLTLGVGALALLSLAQTPWLAFLGMALTGLGSGATYPALSADAVDRVDPGVRGSALGSFMAFGDFGQGMAGPLVGLVSSALGFRWVYGIPAVIVAIGLAVLAIDVSRTIRSGAAAPRRPATSAPR